MNKEVLSSAQRIPTLSVVMRCASWQWVHSFDFYGLGYVNLPKLGLCSHWFLIAALKHNRLH